MGGEGVHGLCLPLSPMDVVPLLLLLPLLILLRATILSKKGRKGSAGLPPSPPTLPVIGNLHLIGQLPHRSFHALSEMYGHVMLLHLGQMKAVVLSSREVAEEVMKTNDVVFANRPDMKVAGILLYGKTDMSFSPYGDYFRNLRKLFAVHLVNTRRVHSFGAAREAEVVGMLRTIGAAAEISRPVDLTRILLDVSTNVACRVVSRRLRSDGGAGGRRYALFAELVKENMRLLGGFSMVDLFPFLSWLGGDNFGMCKAAKRNFALWDALLDEVLEEAAAAIADEPEKPKEDFVDVLLSLQKNRHEVGFDLSADAMKALLMDVIAGAIDTTAVTTEWAMAELIRHPGAMRKLQDEVRQRAAGCSEIVTNEETNGMTYLKAVVKETLRLHPAAPTLLPRAPLKDCFVGGYRIPKDTTVLVNIWAIGRDTRYWDAPAEFRPERFMTSGSNDQHLVDFNGNHFHFIPFGSGRRTCPGMQFGLALVEIVLANLVARFDWELPSEEALDMTEVTGLVVGRKEKLVVLPIPLPR